MCWELVDSKFCKRRMRARAYDSGFLIASLLLMLSKVIRFSRRPIEFDRICASVLV